MALSDKQRRFVDEFLVDLNATQAAIRAGYSARSARANGSRMLANADIADAIAAAQVARGRRTGITADRVLAELGRIGFSDVRAVVNWSSNVVDLDVDPATGEPRLRINNQVVLNDSAGLSADVAATIAEVSQSKDGALKVKLHDKLSALVRLGQHHGLFKPVGPAKPADGLPPEPPRAHPDSMEGLLN